MHGRSLLTVGDRELTARRFFIEGLSNEPHIAAESPPDDPGCFSDRPQVP